MSRRAIALAALAAALVVAPAAVEAQSPVRFGLAAGATFPQGDIADGLDWGYHVAGSVTGRPMNSPFGVRGEVMWHSMKANDESLFEGEDLNILGLLVNAEIGMSGVGVKPYFIGGLGYYRSTFGDFDAENDFGFNLGAGIDFALAGFSAFTEVRWHSIQTEGDASNFIPLTFGLRF